ncbi:hypothetical protein C7212DRAFT_304589 [Tuber magnatum]|uniref:Uncharacterized protein n=1 Tax=Tuber magnatum TaxID=42249 RepID=A0A317SWG5_9PEZI|nr:hypothetical protein C7212DRAFT_304589 [Tuber magnatum]
MAPRKVLNLSRVKVYAEITILLDRLSKIPTPSDYQAGIPSELTSGGIENAPKPIVQRHKWHCKVAELHHLLSRLQLVFRPDSLKMKPGAEWVLSYYPPDPECFSSWESLLHDDMKRVSSVIRDNDAKIARICQWLSDGMALARGDLDGMRRSIIVSRMESLGEEWALLEAKSEAAVLWFDSKWFVDRRRK